MVTPETRREKRKTRNCRSHCSNRSASYNERSWWDNHRAYDLGYRPTGRGEDFRDVAFWAQSPT
jgi:hypothetical protein